jgi:hypothetical protein
MKRRLKKKSRSNQTTNYQIIPLKKLETLEMLTAIAETFSFSSPPTSPQKTLHASPQSAHVNMTPRSVKREKKIASHEDEEKSALELQQEIVEKDAQIAELMAKVSLLEDETQKFATGIQTR